MKIRGIDYNVEVISNGEPIVLLHGFTGCIANWNHILAEFPQHQLVLIDIIGHGKTESPSDPSRYEMNEVVKDIVDILDTLSINRANILGYSMGGRLALSVAASFPERVKTLILESSSPGLNTPEERHNRKVSDEKLAEEILSHGVEKFVQRWEEIPLFSTQDQLSLETKQKLRLLRLQNNPVGLANSLIGMGTGSQPSWWEQLPSIEIPVLLLCGEWDIKFCDIAKNMHKYLPTSYLKEINHAGHTIHVEQPRIFGKIVSEFLSQNN